MRRPRRLTSKPRTELAPVFRTLREPRGMAEDAGCSCGLLGGGLFVTTDANTLTDKRIQDFDSIVKLAPKTRPLSRPLSVVPSCALLRPMFPLPPGMRCQNLPWRSAAPLGHVLFFFGGLRQSVQ